jgi:ankyrin repeat protein
MTKSRVVGCVALVAFVLAGVAGGAGRSDIADAVMRGDKAAVRALLQQKQDVNAPQVDGATALHWAVYRDDIETAKTLIGAGAKVDMANREGITPLAMASLYGNPAIIDALLKAGADVTQRGPTGETVLMLAARNGNPQAIKRLVASGADVNAKESRRGTTALMWAVDQKHPSAVKTLIELGADVSARSGPAGLPRNYMAPRVDTDAVQQAAERYASAAAAGRTYQEQLEWEAAHGAKISMGFRGTLNAGGSRVDRTATAPATSSGQSAAAPAPAAPVEPAAPSSAAAAAPAAGAAPPENADEADLIVAGLVGAGSGGLTAMVLAARENDIESVAHLVNAGADVNQGTEYGWTPLLTATNNRHYKLSTFLLEHGADPNIANKGRWTPLYLATDNRNIEGGDYPVPKPDLDSLEYIRTLLDYGADPNARIKDNTLTRTIFTMQWLFEDGATAFVRASQSSDLVLMKLLLDYGADPTIATANRDTALTVAGGIGWVEGVTYEWSKQANIAAVKLLLDLGLDPNAANKEGRTALMGAAIKGRNEVVQLLVDRGARLDTRDGGSRDTDNSVSVLAGHTWQAIDYADGLVRTGVQSAIARPETAALIRTLMTDRGLTVPPPNRVIESICVVSICQERVRK